MFFMQRKMTTQFFKRMLVSGMMFLTLAFFGSPEKALAGAWGEPTQAAFLENMLAKIARQMEGAVIGQLKMAAVQMLNNQVGQLIGGGAAGQPRFITNFNDFLYQGPLERTNLYMNDFFTLTTRGRGSSANYIGIGDAGGIGGGYASYLRSVGTQATVQKGTTGRMNLEEYTASPQTMFAEGDFRAFNAFFSNPYNNPYGYSLEAEKVYQDKLAKEQQAASVEATSSGFLGAKQGDTVIAPAGSIQAMTTKIQNLPSDIIANATNPAELMGGVVSAMANQVVNNLVRNGIGQVQANIQRQIGGVSAQVNSARNQATGLLGPAAPFTTSVLQRSIQVNPSTPTLSNTVTGGY